MIHLMNTAIINNQTNIDERCIQCFIRTYQRLGEKFNCSPSQMLLFNTRAKEIFLKHKTDNSPVIQRELNQIFCQIIDNFDPFAEEKRLNNSVALKLYEQWKPKVLSAKDPFDLALRLAVAGNIMDYGANNNFNISETINQVLNASFAIDDALVLKNRISNAKNILYLGDNVGEVVFDRLFIETLMHHDVTYVVKGGPIINDVTLKDADEVEMGFVADVISNGYNAPSTVLSESSKQFLELYRNADLIISKGQGNFEGLMNEHDPRIFFLLMAKCDVIAEILGVKKGSFIVYNQK